MHRIVALALAATSLATADLPKFDQVSNGFKEVVSTADGSLLAAVGSARAAISAV